MFVFMLETAGPLLVAVKVLMLNNLTDLRSKILMDAKCVYD